MLAQWPNQHNEPLHWGIIKMCTCITASHSMLKHSRQFRSYNPILAVMSGCIVRQVGSTETAASACAFDLDHYSEGKGKEQTPLKLEVFF